MSRLVLWGRRKGDVQYASRDFWRRNIPIGDDRLTVSAAQFFDVGDVVDIVGAELGMLRITGIEGTALGVR